MKSKILKFLTLAAALCGATAWGATVAVTTQAELENAVNAANSGDTIELSAAEYTLYGKNANTSGKALTFIGEVDAQGNPATTWKYGNTSAVDGERGSDYSFDGAGTITFKNVILRDNLTVNSYFRGFIRANGMVFENCTIKNMMGYLGVGDVLFKNCTFDVESTCDYAVKMYSGQNFTFDGCTFKGNNKGFIQAYMQDATETRHAVVVKDCNFVQGSGTPSKTAVYFYDQGDSEGARWNIDFQGTNINPDGVVPTSPNSNSWLWGDMKYQASATAVVKESGTTVWANNAKVEAAAPAVAKIGTTEYTDLAEAINAAQAGDTVEILVANTYKLPTIPSGVTVKAATDVDVVIDIKGITGGASTCTFEGVTFDCNDNQNYTGYRSSSKLVFNKCTFRGEFWTYATEVICNECTFEKNKANDGNDRYALYVYGSKTVTLDNCTFDTDGKAVKIAKDGDPTPVVVMANECTFNSISVNKNAFMYDTRYSEITVIAEDCVFDENYSSEGCEGGKGALFDEYGATSKYDGLGAVGTGLQFDANNKLVAGTLTQYFGDIFAEGFEAKANVDGTFLVASVVLAKGEDGKFHIASYDDLLLFKKMVNEKGMNFSGETVVLDADISCTETWTAAIGTFTGTLDGNGKTISKLKVASASDHAALFSKIEGATVLGLTISEAEITSASGNYNAVLAAEAVNSTITGVQILSSTVTTAGEYAGAVYGGGYAAVSGCTVDKCAVTGTEQIGGLAGYMWLRSITDCTISETTVTATAQRAGLLVGKLQVAKDNLGASSMSISGNTVDGKVVTPAVAGGLIGQIMGDDPRYEIKDNDIDVVFECAGEKAPIGVLRSSQAVAFTEKISTNITGNWWENATLDANEYTYTNTNGAGDQVVVRGVAQVGTTTYKTLAEAVAAATAGQTITLISDVADAGNVSLKAGVTLDGDGHKVTGNSAVYINEAGGTVQRVVFEDIHDAASKLSAVYATRLAGTATITGCTFDNCDWDAIQATPVAGAVLTITGNVFDTDNTDGVQQQRYVHIESAANVDFKATVTGNVMNGDTKQGALEAYYFADEEKINVSHNYIEDMADVCILDGTGALRNDMVFPAYKDAEKTELYQPVAMIATSAYSADYYPTLAEAVAAATAGQTITLIADTTVTAMIPITKNVTIDLNGHVITDMVVGDRVFKFATAGVDLTIDGTVEGSGMTIPGEYLTSFNPSQTKYWGFVRCDYPRCSITLNGGTYSGPTQNGSMVTTRKPVPAVPEDQFSSVTLNGVSMTTSETVLDIHYAKSLTVKDCTLIARGGFDNVGTPVSRGVFVECCPDAQFDNVKVSSVVVDIEVVDGVATFNDCTFEAKAGWSGTVDATNIGVSYLGHATVNGGTYTIVNPDNLTGKTGANIYVYSSGGTIDVNGGTFVGLGNTINVGVDTGSYPEAEAIVNVADGTFTGGINKYNGSNEKCSVNIKGGVFSVDPTDSALAGFVHIADGYMAKAQGTTPETWTIVAAVAKIGDTYYATLDAAVAAVQDGETITVLNYDAANMTAPDGWKFETADGVTTLVHLNFYQDAENANLWHVVNAAGWREFAAAVNGGTSFEGKTVQLDSDIDFDGATVVPVGNHSDNKPFKGTFDGRGFKLSNINIHNVLGKQGVGVFGKVYAPCVIKDLTVENATVTGDKTVAGDKAIAYVGGIAGHGYATIQNCVFKGSIYGGHQMGGIAGSGGFTITGCTFEGAIVSERDWGLGGIIGNCQDGGAISGNTAKGSISAKDSNSYGFIGGGIVGCAIYTSYDIKNNYSQMSMTWDGTAITDFPVVGVYNINALGTGNEDFSKLVTTLGGNTWDKAISSSDTYLIKYNNEHPSESGYVLVYDAPTRPVHYIAQVGDVKYETLAEAFDAAKTGDTVTLLSDITLTEQVNITKALDGLTLDGNGKTITCATTDDPFKSGGSALYFGNANDHLYCTGIKIKNLTMTGTARYAIFLCGGTTTEFTNVTISGNYYIAVNLYGTHGATMTDCDISNSTTGSDKYLSAIWSNVASANPLTLNNSKVDVIAINAYTTANTLEPKIFVMDGSEVGEIHTFDDGSVSGNKKLCVSASSTGTYVVKEYDASIPAWVDIRVAAIGTVGYATLAEAVAAATAGQTVTLLADVNVTEQVEVSGKAISLDLAGHTIAYTGTAELPSGVLLVHNGAGLTINDSSEGKSGKITSGENAYAAVAVTKKGDDAALTATLTVNAGTLTGRYYGISGNGTRHNTAITVNGGTIASTAGTGIYHPQNGTLTISGGSVTGVESAVEVRAGDVNISGGSLTATASGSSSGSNTSGTSVSGAALAISQHTTQLPINVTITGGTFTGTKAVYEVNPQGNASPDVTLTITDGTFYGEVSSADCTAFISGGMFDAAVPEVNCAEGYVPSNALGNGLYTVVVDTPNTLTAIVDDDTSMQVTIPEVVIFGKYGAAEGDTAEQTLKKQNAYINEVEANGLKVWQNYVMGVNGSVEGNKLLTDYVVGGGEGDGEWITVKTPIAAFNPPTDSGITVKYRLLRTATPDGATSWQAFGELKDTPSFPVNIAGQEGDTFWKIEVVFQGEAANE